MLNKICKCVIFRLIPRVEWCSGQLYVRCWPWRHILDRWTEQWLRLILVGGGRPHLDHGHKTGTGQQLVSPRSLTLSQGNPLMTGGSTLKSPRFRSFDMFYLTQRHRWLNSFIMSFSDTVREKTITFIKYHTPAKETKNISNIYNSIRPPQGQALLYGGTYI